MSLQQARPVDLKCLIVNGVRTGILALFALKAVPIARVPSTISSASNRLEITLFEHDTDVGLKSLLALACAMRVLLGMAVLAASWAVVIF